MKKIVKFGTFLGKKGKFRIFLGELIAKFHKKTNKNSKILDFFWGGKVNFVTFFCKIPKKSLNLEHFCQFSPNSEHFWDDFAEFPKFGRKSQNLG